MRVTIISDASCSTDMKHSAYAFWAVSGRGRAAHAGAFKEVVSSTAEAETKAIINAVHVAFRIGILCDGDQLLVQTDALGAIRALTGKLSRKKSIAKFAPIVKVFHDAITARSVTVEFRHVKGHTKASTHTDNRYRAQRNVDRAARTAMRKQRSANKKSTTQGATE